MHRKRGLIPAVPVQIDVACPAKKVKCLQALSVEFVPIDEREPVGIDHHKKLPVGSVPDIFVYIIEGLRPAIVSTVERFSHEMLNRLAVTPGKNPPKELLRATQFAIEGRVDDRALHGKYRAQYRV